MKTNKGYITLFWAAGYITQFDTEIGQDDKLKSKQKESIILLRKRQIIYILYINIIDRYYKPINYDH